jgi:hypothetical protein
MHPYSLGMKYFPRILIELLFTQQPDVAER